MGDYLRKMWNLENLPKKRGFSAHSRKYCYKTKCCNDSHWKTWAPHNVIQFDFVWPPSNAMVNKKRLHAEHGVTFLLGGGHSTKYLRGPTFLMSVSVTITFLTKISNFD